MGNDKKTRCDTFDAGFSDVDRWRLYDSCRQMPWYQAADWCKTEFGVEPSRPSWYRFLARMRKDDAARRIERIAESVASAEDIAERAQVKNKVLVEMLKTIAVDRALAGSGEDAATFAKAAMDVWDRIIKEQELGLKRDKFTASEKRLEAAKGALADARLTAEEKEAKLREIFG